MTLHEIEGERRLRLAVLEDALAILDRAVRDPKWRHRRATLDAVDWLLRDESEWPFAFVPVCEALGMYPARLRRMLATRLATLSAAFGIVAFRAAPGSRPAFDWEDDITNAPVRAAGGWS